MKLDKQVVDNEILCADVSKVQVVNDEYLFSGLKRLSYCSAGTIRESAPSMPTNNLMVVNQLVLNLFKSKTASKALVNIFNEKNHKKENIDVLEEFKRKGICKKFVSVMEDERDNEELLYQACLLIGRLAYLVDDFRVAFIEAGSAEAIVDATQKFMENVQVQRYGLSALANLVRGSELFYVQTIVAAGAIHASVLALKLHSTAINGSAGADIVRYAVRCLNNIAYMENPTLGKQLLEEGAIEVIVATMYQQQDCHNHYASLSVPGPHTDQVQKLCCRFLLSLLASNQVAAVQKMHDLKSATALSTTFDSYRGKSRSIAASAASLLNSLFEAYSRGLIV